jgi:glutamyl/glutaminyl-tRNA synthetase
MDAHSLRRQPVTELMAQVEPHLLAAFGTTSRQEGTVFSAAEWLQTFVTSVTDEMVTLEDAVVLGRPIFEDQFTMTPEAEEALRGPSDRGVLSAFVEGLPAIEPFDYDTVNEYFRSLRARFKSEQALSGRQVMFPIRVALTGTLKGPCLVIIAILLGKRRCQQRAQTIIDHGMPRIT